MHATPPTGEMNAVEVFAYLCWVWLMLLGAIVLHYHLVTCPVAGPRRLGISRSSGGPAHGA